MRADPSTDPPGTGEPVPLQRPKAALIRIPRLPSFPTAPSILAGRDNIVRVAYSRGQAALGIFDIYYITYNGSTWTSPFQLTTQTSTQDSNPSFMQDRNGTLWIFWARNVIVSPSNSVYVI